MEIGELESVVEWATYYRQQFHLPVGVRGGYVMMAVTNEVSLVHMPHLQAEKVFASLRQRGSPGPLLARQTRWSFIASVDYSPGGQIIELLTRHNICVPVVGSALMLPTSLGRWTREGAYWIKPPSRIERLPQLSVIITTALAVSTNGDRC